ncbi:MAG: aromatic ring-hydroxylating dioxygenase subunit alpha [Asticcacaulis sp.]
MYKDLLGQIPADAYVREDVLAAELAQVFRPSWLCVGFTEDLKHHQDFITVQIGPHSVVVQNFKGELRAFRNVCSHRFARIQTQCKGNRRLVCPYHGWLYNADGVPVGIPHNETAFGLDEAGREALALQAYDVETVGAFVFVRMDGDSPKSESGLKAFLGEVYDVLKGVSATCPHRIEDVTLDIAANWKLCLENGVEAYHHAMVHTDTFATVLNQDIVMNTYGPHCTHEGRMTDKGRQDWNRLIRRAALRPDPASGDYISFLIFPNIVTTFTAGALFTFQMLFPASATQTRIHSTAWLAQGNDAVRPFVSAPLTQFAHKVREEDRQICEIAQTGVGERHLNRAAVLGSVDNRIRHFQQAYTERMQTEVSYV